MITPIALQALRDTWDYTEAQRPDTVPEVAFRLWLTAHALVNGRIPIEQAAYLHAEENLHGQYTLEEMCVAYEQTLTALQEIVTRRSLLHHLWRALTGWECYDPTPEARAANHKAKIDLPLRESLLNQLLRSMRHGR